MPLKTQKVIGTRVVGTVLSRLSPVWEQESSLIKMSHLQITMITSRQKNLTLKGLDIGPKEIETGGKLTLERWELHWVRVHVCGFLPKGSPLSVRCGLAESYGLTAFMC